MRGFIVLTLLFSGLGFAADGRALFKSKGCEACHLPTDNTVAPSLKEIAQAYAGREDQLLRFLKEEAPAIVDPDRFAIMKAQLKVLKGLSDKELKAIAEYIMSFK